MAFNASLPVYMQIADDVKRRIINGEIAEGEKLPSVRESSARYDVTTLTMQRAMAALEQQGITQTQAGIGSFVQPGVAAALREKEFAARVDGFVREMRQRGYEKQPTIQAISEVWNDDNT